MKIFFSLLLLPLTVIAIPLFVQTNQKMEGVYKSDATACHISIEITKVGKAYHYQLKSKNLKVEGELSIIVNKESKDSILIFKGLKKAEPSELKGGNEMVSAAFSNGEITVQNYGNAMNEYIQLRDCDMKYIICSKK